MPRRQQDPALVLDMMDSARAIVEMVSGMAYTDYAGDRRTRRAIEREVEIIGEAARKVSQAFQNAHPEVPWRKIVAQRHKLAHEYGEIEDEILWRVATVHIPELIDLLAPLLPSVPPEQDN